MKNKIVKKIDYDSNPFTLSFKGLGLLLEYAKGVFIAILVLGFIGFIPNIFNLFPSNSNSSTSTSSNATYSEPTAVTNIDWGSVAAISMLVISVIVIIFFVAMFLSAVYNGFVSAGAVAASEKRMISAGEAFSEMSSRLGVMFKAEIIIALKIVGGYLLLIVPGVRAQLRYQSTPFIIMKNKKMTAGDAINKSKELYENHLMESFGIMTIGAIVPFIGGAISASGMALSVKQLTEYEESNLKTPKTHWLNYIGLIFIGVIFLLIFSFIALAITLNTN